LERVGEVVPSLFPDPTVGTFTGFRWAILRGETPLYWPGLAMSAAVIAILLATGVWYFRRVERTFADVIEVGVRSLLYVVQDNYPRAAVEAGALHEHCVQTGRLLTGLIHSTESRRA
jgi:hypothetical protein